MRFLGKILLLLALVTSTTVLHADELMMVRTQLDFPEAMLKLQELIKKQGYVVSRVQRVDIGLTKSGYKTDKYRVVFFGKADEVDILIKQYPAMAAYLPLKIAIFAENTETLLVSINPNTLFAGMDDKLTNTLKQWEKDMYVVFDNMRRAGDD